MDNNIAQSFMDFAEKEMGRTKYVLQDKIEDALKDPIYSIFGEDAVQNNAANCTFSDQVKKNEGQGDQPKTTTKEQGMTRAEQNASQEWNDEAMKVIARLASYRQEFTTDDVLPLLTCETHDTRALGAMMKEAAKKKLIRKTDRFIPSKLPQRHSRPIQLWQSMIF